MSPRPLAAAAAALCLLFVGAALADNTTTHPHPPAITFAECQKKTADPLQGCPDGTVYVSPNDTRASYPSIQAAILSLPDDDDDDNLPPYYILVGAGTYVEQLNVTRPRPLYLLGQSDLPSRHASYNSNDNNQTTTPNDVQVHWDVANVGNTLLSDNVYTGVLTVGPTLNATLTGSGPTGFAVPDDTPFGCRDFRAYNIDFRNEYAPYAVGPAHALGVSRANAGFYSCGFYSWQDTIYVGKLGNAYFYDTIVAGQTDFLYGFGTLYVTRSTLLLRHCGGGITAWKGTNTSVPNKYGVYLDATRLVADNATTQADIAGRCALGRPWNDAHRSVFMGCFFDTSILPAGYVEWSTTEPRVDNYTFMATWADYGPGWDPAAERASNLTRVLDDTEVAPYRWPVDVFLESNGTAGNIGWIDQSVLVPF